MTWSATSMIVCRFLFGMGEAGAFPIATRSLSRWMLPSERGFAQGITHAGSRLGGALTPIAVVFLIAHYGWRAPFYIFALLGLIWAEAPRHEVARQQQALITLQRPDGGWGQMPTLSSDAYATGQALYALQVAGVGAKDPVYRRGVDFLLRTQLEDGTWFVRTRAFGVQPYVETGFPHGPSPVISASASGWAASARAQAAR